MKRPAFPARPGPHASHASHASHSSRRGAVLIVVLWACLGLVSMALLFGHAMLMNYRGADDDIAGRQAEQAIEGAARYTLTLLANADNKGHLPETDTYECEAVPVGEAAFWMLGRPTADEASLAQEYGLIDEGAKLNLNTATAAMLAALPGMTEELAAAIVDWRDTNEEVTANGAESETYLRLQPAYEAKNAPFESTEELALLNGADRAVLEGEDANRNGVLDPNEDDGDKTLPPDNSDGSLARGVLDYVTVWSREPNKRADGTARINISQPNPELNTLLSDAFGSTRTEQVLTAIGPNPRFRSTLEFFARSGLTAEEFAKIEDALSVSSEAYLPGLINVNSASAAVLACVPGIGQDKAESIVAGRTATARTGRSLAWVAEILGPQGCVQAGPYLTGQSWQFSADVAAVGRHGRGCRRSLLVFDTSTGSPRIVYRRNLAPLGWALGGEVRQTFAQQKASR